MAITGCGGDTTGATISGKIVPPSGVKLEETDSINIRFVPAQGDSKASAGSASGKDLSFTCSNLTPGKYKVVVQFQPYAGSKGFEDRSRAFDRVNKLFDDAASKLSYDVTSDPKQSVTVDMAKGSVTKG